ncbi:MAG TPA: ATP-dependent Clp protease ATP-binding subunit [Bacteroidales bacterium]|nr:ATP-dependent Clp protease ATP-binding subunit [Bacteroidales bacterium]
MESIQQLYNEAFQYWEAKETDKAKERIEKALELAPDNLQVRALAMYIYQAFTEEFIVHAEFIVDSDIHFEDTISPRRSPHDFLDWLIMSYHFVIKDDEKMDEEEKKNQKSLKERAYLYTRKILECGYGTDHLDYFLDYMNQTERYDEIIDFARYIVEEKTPEELGLPGLKKSEKLTPDEGRVLHHEIMDAFFLTGRDIQALNWCNKYITIFPKDWTIYFARGEVYCRLNQPEETARQWIIGTQMAGFDDWFTSYIDPLMEIVADKDCLEKKMLYNRVRAIKDSISDELKALYEKIQLDTFIVIGKPEKKPISPTYVEGKLHVKLPPVEKDDYFPFDRLWLPKKLGQHPYIPLDPDQQNDDIQIIPGVMTARPDTIERYGIDITDQVRQKKNPPVVGRDKEIDALIRILIRMEKNNPVLLGEAGVGKTAIIQGLAQRINSEIVPEYLRNKRIIELSMSALVGGTRWRGDFESRLTDIIRELKENKDIILFVDELHTIMGAGAANRGDLDVANIAKPALAKGEIRLVGATTYNEYAKYIEKDQAMARRFTPVHIAEMDKKATLEVLKHRVEFWKEHHHVYVPDETLIYAIDLSDDRIRNRRFPDKAIDLLDESCALVSTKRKKQNTELLTLHPDHVNQVFKEWTGTAPDQSEKVIHNKPATDKKQRVTVVESLKKYLVAQPDVIDKLSSLVVQLQNSIKDPVIPQVLLFFGEPGNGKTTAALALEKALWPSETDRLMVLDLAEYSEQFSYDRLVGGPPGYAGYNDDGIISYRIKRKPYSIILLKNVAQAHPQVINFFGSLFRSGSFFDKKGQNILAGDTIFILHVNSLLHGNKIGFSSSQNPATNDNKIPSGIFKGGGLPSQWVNIYFRSFYFHTLTNNDLNEVLDICINNLKIVYEQKGILLSVSKKMKEQLLSAFYEMKGDKRNAEELVNYYIVPKIREKLLKLGLQASRPLNVKL